MWKFKSAGNTAMDHQEAALSLVILGEMVGSHPGHVGIFRFPSLEIRAFGTSPPCCKEAQPPTWTGVEALGEQHSSQAPTSRQHNLPATCVRVGLSASIKLP